MNEFEKLDRFVENHKPKKDQILTPYPALSQNKPIWGFVSAGIFFCLIGLGVLKITNIKNYDDENLFIQESLDWEEEDDGLYDYYDLI